MSIQNNYYVAVVETTSNVVSSTAPEICDFDMGLNMKATNTISAATFSASSTTKDSSPDYGRLNHEIDGYPAAWKPAFDVAGQYLQVNNNNYKILHNTAKIIFC